MFCAPAAAFVFGVRVSLDGKHAQQCTEFSYRNGGGWCLGKDGGERIGFCLGFAGIQDSKNEANAGDIMRFSKKKVHVVETSAVLRSKMQVLAARASSIRSRVAPWGSWPAPGVHPDGLLCPLRCHVGKHQKHSLKCIFSHSQRALGCSYSIFKAFLKRCGASSVTFSFHLKGWCLLSKPPLTASFKLLWRGRRILCKASLKLLLQGWRIIPQSFSEGGGVAAHSL